MWFESDSLSAMEKYYYSLYVDEKLMYIPCQKQNDFVSARENQL